MLVGKTVAQTLRNGLVPRSFIDMNNDVLAGGTPSISCLRHYTGTARDAHLLWRFPEEQPAREGG